MIKIIEKDLLEDNFIIKGFTKNIKLKDKITFTKDDTYYFGNYKKSDIDIIKKKILKNKKSIIRAINKGVKFIIHGNSIDIFNNNFNKNEFNLFTAFEKKDLRIKRKKLKIKNKKHNKYIIVNNLKRGIDTLNFRYKNLICIK